MAEHKFLVRPTNVKMKVRGGVIRGCSCNWVTITADVQTAIKAHAQHKKDAEAAEVSEAV